jgi:hypothetical protein
MRIRSDIHSSVRNGQCLPDILDGIWIINLETEKERDSKNVDNNIKRNWHYENIRSPEDGTGSNFPNVVYTPILSTPQILGSNTPDGTLNLVTSEFFVHDV